MKIEVGKSYMTRGGEVINIVTKDTQIGVLWPFLSEDWQSKGLYHNSWGEDGYLSSPEAPNLRDLVSPANAVPPAANKCLLPENSYVRKDIPITTGVLDYFPLAIAAVAELSKQGNDKHNPGEPLHWARGKSTDHADCIARHLIDRGRFAADGTRHTASLAWRALALLQEELEAEAGTGPVSR